MPQNPHIIRKRTRDAGTAQQMADVTRRLRKTEGQSTVIGQGATISAPSITTASGKNGIVPSGAMIVMQGNNGFYPTVGAGIYCTDSSGDIALYIQPGVGLVLTTGSSDVNNISWYTGNHLDGAIVVQEASGGALVTLAAEGASPMSIGIGSYSAGNGAVAAYYGGILKATLSDANGSGTFQGTVTATEMVVGNTTITNGVVRAGNAAMGTWPGSAQFAVFGFEALPANSYALLQQNDGSNTFVNATAEGHLRISNNDCMVWFNYGTPAVSISGNLSVADGVIASTYSYSSDRSLKKDIELLESTDVISRLKPVTYTLKTTGGRHHGFVAQDVQDVIPDAVWNTNLDPKSPTILGYEPNAILAHLVAEVQQLRKRLDEERTA
jgi:hypothetical protein